MPALNVEELLSGVQGFSKYKMNMKSCAILDGRSQHWDRPKQIQER